MTPLIHGLLRPEAYDHPVADLQLLETHISWVILTGQFAYKLKKPVNLGFVDFTTLDLRKKFCDEEVRLNRRLAPDLYLGVRPIFGSEQHPTLVGTGPPIEFAVQMRQFDQSQLLPAVLQRGELRVDHIDQLAVTLSEFHRHAGIAEASSPFGTSAAVREPVFANFEHLASAELTPEQLKQIDALRSWGEKRFGQLRDWFQERHDRGFIRECHGDLHLGNMVLLDDAIRPFDCLEFNPGLRWIDVVSEMAFLVMDLQDRGRPDLAYRVLNRWLEQSGDYAGLAGWNWYFCYRAMVRAKVAALRMMQPDVPAAEVEAKRKELATYISLAARSIEPAAPRLLIMHGLSGSGKSHIAQWISVRFGAVQIRSDVERKRLFGQWGSPAEVQLLGDMYRPDVTQSVYDRTASLAKEVLAAGFSVIVDAACLKRWQRTIFRELSEKLAVPSLLIDVQADPETLRNRLRQRQAAHTDPSDADQAVLDQQLFTYEPILVEEGWQTITVDTNSISWPRQLEHGLQESSRN